MGDHLEETKPVQVNTEASTNVTNPSTEVAQYRPTPFMEKWLDAALQMETDDITAIANACGIDRTTWYKWLKDEAFVTWFRASWDKGLSGHAWKLDVVGLKNAKRDFKYWESMQKRVGNLTEGKTTNVQVNTQVNLDKYME